MEKHTFRCCSREKENSEDNANEPVPFIKLFSFASNIDKMLLAISVVACLIHGVCLPIMRTLFGEIAKVIVDSTNQGNSDADFINSTLCPTSLSFNSTTLDVNFMKNEKDEIVHAIFAYAIGTTAFVFLSVFLQFTIITCMNIAAENQVYRLRNAVVKVILTSEISWHDKINTDGLAVQISEDLVKIQNGIGEKVGIFLSHSSIAVCSLVTAFYYGWELASVMLIILPALTISTGVLAKIQTSHTTLETQAYASAGSLAEEIIRSIKTVTMFGAQEKEVARFEAALKPAQKAGIKRGLVTAIGGGFFWVLTFLSFSLSFWYGIRLVLQSMCNPIPTNYNIGTLNIVFFNMYCTAIKLGQLLPFFEVFSVARVSASNIYKILDQNPEISSSSTTGKRLEIIGGHIQMEEVYFNYPTRPNVDVLRGINIEVGSGRTVALVGQSGCGKSTCFQLLQRFYDPVRGRITIDGHELKTLNVSWWRENIGVVGQEPVLFSTTIRDNIKYGHHRLDQVSQKDVEHAARLAHVHDFIVSLPNGYDTLVGERGSHLSGGQKQRIAIARALIRNPKILLFDEATSALDTKSEARVQQALDKAREGRTTLIIAHRLTTIRNADLILVFNEGKIEEIGTHDSLMSKRGLYYKLIESQQQSFTPNHTTSDNDTSDHIQDEESSSVDSRSLCRLKLDIPQCAGIGSMQNESQDNTKGDKVDVSMSKLLHMNKPEWKYIILGVIGSIILGLSTPVYAIVYGEVMGLLDQSLQQDVHHLNNVIALIFVGVAVGTGLGSFLQTFMLAIAGEKLTFRLRILTIRSILGQKIEFFDHIENSVGTLCARLSSDASVIQGITGIRIGIIVQVSVNIIFALTLSMFYSWKLALVCSVFVPLVLLSAKLGDNIKAGQNSKKAKALEESTRVAAEAISNIRTVVSLGREETFHSSYMKPLYNPYILSKKLVPAHALVFGLANNISQFGYVACMVYGTYLIRNEGLAYKNMLIVGEALIYGMEMVGQMMTFTPNYNQAKTSATRIFKLIESNNTSPKTAVLLDEKGTLKFDGKVEFDQVNFCYPTRANVPVLRGLSITIHPGQTVALVGQSGCGKSTFLQLIQRFYEPNSGNILIDNTNIVKTSTDFIRSNLGIVSQEPTLFNRTIAENIAYGDQTRTVTTEEIIQAARKANIHHFIHSLPLGYETLVGQKGAQLSGGQKQRIAIARALIRNPRILLLDEATSALDSESEKVVQDALDQASLDRTCITVAHRISTIKDADVILVFDDKGRIKEQGKHDDLIRLKGIYYQLWIIQGLNDNVGSVNK